MTASVTMRMWRSMSCAFWGPDPRHGAEPREQSYADGTSPAEKGCRAASAPRRFAPAVLVDLPSNRSSSEDFTALGEPPKVCTRQWPAQPGREWHPGPTGMRRWAPRPSLPVGATGARSFSHHLVSVHTLRSFEFDSASEQRIHPIVRHLVVAAPHVLPEVVLISPPADHQHLGRVTVGSPHL